MALISYQSYDPLKWNEDRYLFSPSVALGENTKMHASYDLTKHYIPMNVGDADVDVEIPFISLDVVRDGRKLKEESGFINYDGKPLDITCKSSNPQVCECSSFGTGVSLTPKSSGSTKISINALGKTIECKFEFIKAPVKVFSTYEPVSYTHLTLPTKA